MAASQLSLTIPCNGESGPRAALLIDAGGKCKSNRSVKIANFRVLGTERSAKLILGKEVKPSTDSRSKLSCKRSAQTTLATTFGEVIGLPKNLMNEQEYLDKAIELAAKCKAFAEKTCRQWKEQTSGDVAGWKSLSEISAGDNS